MHPALKGEIFCRCQGRTRRRYPFDRWIVRKVDEKNDTFHRTGLLKITDKIVRFLKCDTHSGEYDRERGFGSGNRCLACDLSGQFGMRQTKT